MGFNQVVYTGNEKANPSQIVLFRGSYFLRSEISNINACIMPVHSIQIKKSVLYQGRRVINLIRQKYYTKCFYFLTSPVYTLVIMGLS